MRPFLLRLFTVLLLAVLLLAPVPAAGAAGQRSAQEGVAWDYQLTFDASSMQQARQVLPELRKQGVTVSLRSLDKAYRLDMHGNQGLEQARQALFSPALAGFLGGPAVVYVSLPAGVSQVSLRLESNITTGYSWQLISSLSQGYQHVGQPAFEDRSRAYGAASVQTMLIRANSTPSGNFELAYRRPFGPTETASRHLFLYYQSNVASIDLTDPHPVVAGLTLASPGDVNSLLDPLSTLPLNASLPASLDWRDAGIVPPIRNQGSCGSCWAFGTVGIMESALAKSDQPLTNLSEQFLVSCNTYGWNCEAGGLTAHMWHYDTLGKNQTTIGAVLEADKPYIARDGTCEVAYEHPFVLSGWEYIASDEWTVPSVQQLKAAIAAYGPVTAGICAGISFSNYHGGIFSTDETCGRSSTNHQIILVGWNDADGGYWILRNSWGAWWGESGYMRIAYNTSRVGEGASWVAWNRQFFLPYIYR